MSELNSKQLRNFGLTTGVIVGLLFGLLLPWLFEHAYPMWPWVIAAVLWTMALLAPLTLRPVFKVWMRFGHVLGWINTRIILGMLFFTLFLVVSLVLKLLGNDPMARKIDKQAHTYRVTSRPRPRNHMERPF